MKSFDLSEVALTLNSCNSRIDLVNYRICQFIPDFSYFRVTTIYNMANSYKKVYLHIVFAVKNRNALLHKSWRDRVFSYIAGSLNSRGHYSLAVNGFNDHIHIFFDYSCNELVADLVRELKKASSRLIKDEKLTKHKFEWQSGYGVFSQ